MKGFIYRAYRLCDEKKDLMDEVGFLKDIYAFQINIQLESGKYDFGSKEMSF